MIGDGVRDDFFGTGSAASLYFVFSHEQGIRLFQMKFVIYLWWVAGEDEETQRNGIVNVYWPGEINFPDKREAEEADRVLSAVPCRIAALHQCLQDGPLFRLMNAVVILSLDVETKTRIKFHTGKKAVWML
jgi:hypothetical protein